MDLRGNPVLSSQVKMKERPDGALIFIRAPRKSIQAYAVNATGQFIIKACDGQRSVEEISKKLAQKFKIPFEIALEDTNKFFESLNKIGAILFE